MKKDFFVFCAILLTLSGCVSPKDNLTEDNINTAIEESSELEIPEPAEEEELSSFEEMDSTESFETKEIVLGFAGDINFDEAWSTMLCYNEQTNGLSDCIDTAIINDVKDCDLFMLNNEFTYSNRGTPMEGKMYTFRADPKRVELLKEMGVDIVLLANNHIYDYGKEAMLDTLAILDEAGIDYVGAGQNLEEACRIVYYEVNGITISYVAASRAEKNKMTPQATEESPGILRAYNPDKFIELVKEADLNSDFVVANIHWGTEYSNDVDSVQRELGHELVDAGADAVIGTHPHVLQGIEIYHDSPIFYSLGNFWFNEKDLYSGYVKLTINPVDAQISDIQFIPCVQQSCKTRIYENEEEKQEILDFMESISDNVYFQDMFVFQE